MKNLIVILILILVIGMALYYIIKQKKNGTKCIGCPMGGCCPSKGDGNCNCGK